MEARLRYASVHPGAIQAMRALQDFVNGSKLEHDLLELVKLRASYMNGCAFCVDMHTKDARAAGETEQRLYGVPVWRETPYFSDRERAALAWTEAVTALADTGVPDDVFREAREHFDEAELVELTMAIVAITGWNQLNVAFRTPAGGYRPAGPGRAAT